MSERDNFNLAKFVRNNQLLNEAFEGFGGYKDLTSLKEDNKEELGGWDGDGEHDQYDGEYDGETGPAVVDEAQDDNPLYGAGTAENSWMEEVDGTEEYEVGQFKCYYDYPGYLVWSYSDVPFSKFAVYATPMFDGQDGTPVQVDVNDKTVANLDIPKGIFKSFQDYAKIMVPVLNKLVEKFGDQFQEELEELEKPEKIYADDQEDTTGYEGENDLDRMYGLFELQLQKLVSDIVDDGYEHSDAAQFLRDYADHIDKGGM